MAVEECWRKTINDFSQGVCVCVCVNVSSASLGSQQIHVLPPPLPFAHYDCACCFQRGFSCDVLAAAMVVTCTVCTKQTSNKPLCRSCSPSIKQIAASTPSKCCRRRSSWRKKRCWLKAMWLCVAKSTGPHTPAYTKMRSFSSNVTFFLKWRRIDEGGKRFQKVSASADLVR